MMHVDTVLHKMEEFASVFTGFSRLEGVRKPPCRHGVRKPPQGDRKPSPCGWLSVSL